MLERAAASDGRMPLMILGGYLGAGKSTWLRHQLHVGSYANAHILVNEAAEIPVDHVLLSGASGITVLANGCACCDSAASFVAAMRNICEAPVDEIVLETSGMADPGRLAELVAADQVLVRRIRLRETVVVADALHAARQLVTEPLWHRQIEAADRIVLTKVDAVSDADLRRLAATMALLNPSAKLSGAVLGVTFDLPDWSGAIALKTAGLRYDITPLDTARLDLGDDPRWETLAPWLSALLHARGDQLVRVKGVVRAPSGRLLLQSVRRVMQAPEILPEAKDDGYGGEDNVIIFIGRNLDQGLIERAFWSLTSN